MSALVPSGGVTLEARPSHHLVAMSPQHAQAHQQHQQAHPHHLQHQQPQPQQHSALRAANLPAPAARSAGACAGLPTASTSGRGDFLSAGAHRRRRGGWRGVLRLIRIGRHCDVGRAAAGSELDAVALTRSDPAAPVEAAHDSAQQLALEAHGPASTVVGTAACAPAASVMQRNVSLLNDMHLAGIITPAGSSPGGASPVGSSPTRVSADLDTWRKAWTADDDSKLVATQPVSASCSIGIGNSNQIRRLQRGLVVRAWRLAVQIIGAMAQRISPQGPGSNDQSLGERIVNVLTCLPFFAAGRAFHRTPLASHFSKFGRALNIVGVVAAVYHSSSGHARRLLRKVDYYSIAYTSAVLRSEAIGRVPRAASRIMVLGTAFQPTLVTGVNFVAVEIKLAATAVRGGSRAALRAWLRHAGISLSAITVFKAESARGFHPLMELCHAFWHCLAAGAMLSVAPVLQTQLSAMVPTSTCKSLAPSD